MKTRPLTIFLAFLKLGLTAFGGPAMVAYIREETVRKRGWLDDSDFARGVGVCNTIPGATAMQMAAYVGLRSGGPAGALAAYAGFGLPAFLLMLVLSHLYKEAGGVHTIAAAFVGLKVVVVAIVANAARSFGRTVLKDWRDWLLGSAAAVFIAAGGNPVWAIAAAGALGILLYGSYQDLHGQWDGNADLGLRLWIIFLGVFFVVSLSTMYMLNRNLYSIAALMAKVDLFAFGGGYASLPVMFHEVVDVRSWVDGKTFMDGIALGQITPGPIVITATFVGYLKAGIPGAVVATVGILTPSFIILLSAIFGSERLVGSPLFNQAMKGILATFVGLLMAIAVKFAITLEWNIPAVGIWMASFSALILDIDILWVVAAAGVVSILLF